MLSVSRKLICATFIAVCSLLVHGTPASAQQPVQGISTDPCYAAYRHWNGFTDEEGKNQTGLRQGEVRCGRTAPRPDSLSAVPETIARGTYEQYQRNMGFTIASPSVSGQGIVAGNDSNP